jgi:hypothetical protein
MKIIVGAIPGQIQKDLIGSPVGSKCEPITLGNATTLIRVNTGSSTIREEQIEILTHPIFAD